MISDAFYNDTYRLAYVYEDDFYLESVHIRAIGKEIISSPEYRLNGFTRPDSNKLKDTFEFQYIISGGGILRIGETETRMERGRAFIIYNPSDYEYYLPESPDMKWEKIFVVLSGEWAKRIIQNIINRSGQIMDIEENSDVIQSLYHIFEKTRRREIKDIFEASGIAYMFLMALYRFSTNVISHKYPQFVKRAIQIINTDYQNIKSIDSLASMLCVSKAHLIREFSKCVGVPPGRYLQKTRIGQAIHMLNVNDSTLDEIAARTGFSNGNYLGKLLRQQLGMSIEKYKNQQSIIPNENNDMKG